MGQYYVCADLDKREYIHPWAFGDGAKLREFGCGGLTVTALAVLLADGNGRGGGDLSGQTKADERRVARVAGRWKGDRVVVTGDYADTPEQGGFGSAGEQNIYHEATRDESTWTDISLAVIEALAADRYLRKQIAEGLGQPWSGMHRHYKSNRKAKRVFDRILADDARARLQTREAA